MSGILGLVHLDGAPPPPALLERMADVMAPWGPDGRRLLIEAGAGFCLCLRVSMPESDGDGGPSILPGGHLLTAAARIDNREELRRSLGRAAPDPLGVDEVLVARAYAQWGADAPRHLLGDWAFAAWDPLEHRLCLARDHYGKTSLYFASHGPWFAFASDRRALLTLPWVSRRLNEPYLAQALLDIPAFRGDETPFSDIRRVAPGHCLVVRPGHIEVRRYWRAEDTPEQRRPTGDAYVAALEDALTQAVSSRVRSAGRIGVLLSGGLDSGVVCAVAASQLRAEGRDLAAFTATPQYRPIADRRGRWSDEWSRASAMARHAGVREHVAVNAATVSPLEGVRRMVAIHAEPGRGAADYYWMLALLARAQACAVSTLLNGQSGNATVSWGGARQTAVRRLLNRLRRVWATGGQFRRATGESWQDFSAIHPDFARRIDLTGVCASAGYDLSTGATLDQTTDPRVRSLAADRAIQGAVQAELSAAFGLEIRDPTADVRVIELCLSVPLEEFSGRRNRWLIRRAFPSLVPDVVRLARGRGLQGADVLERMRCDATAIDEAIHTLGRGPAAQYLDFARLRRVASLIRTRNDATAFWLCRRVLLRGLGAAMFIESVDHN